KRAGYSRDKPSGVPSKAAVSPDFREGRVAVANQPEALVGRSVGRRRAIHRSDEVVVQERRSDSQLRPFEPENPMVVPRSLPEGGKGHRVFTDELSAGRCSRVDMLKKLGTIQAGHRRA